MRARDLLLDNHAHIPARSALDGLTVHDADRRVTHVPHSIAEIVAHLAFWQNWFCGRCDGSAVPAADERSARLARAGARVLGERPRPLRCRAGTCRCPRRRRYRPNDQSFDRIPTACGVHRPRCDRAYGRAHFAPSRSDRADAPDAGRVAAAIRQLHLVATADERRGRRVEQVR